MPNVNINIDVNRGLDSPNRQNRRLWRVIVIIAVALIAMVTGVFIYLSLIGKHAKLGLAENNGQPSIIIQQITNNIFYIGPSDKSPIILNFKKYLKFDKDITVALGTNMGVADVQHLSLVAQPWQMNGLKLFNLFYNEDQLYFNCEITGFDETNIATIINDTLQPGKYFCMHATDKDIELIDKYGIPVFQMEMKPDSNMISVRGVFQDPHSITIINKYGIVNHYFENNKNSSNPKTRERALQEYIDYAKQNTIVEHPLPDSLNKKIHHELYGD